mmetsp:Transcript_62762/g.110904  ORF Transcript_62762/g.110904 Transcript_62762/m.110904 type:complete len:206 (-) Transcript_62762:3147-3764(-)
MQAHDIHQCGLTHTACSACRRTDTARCGRGSRGSSSRRRRARNGSGGSFRQRGEQALHILDVVDVILSGTVSLAHAGAEGTTGVQSRRGGGCSQHLVHRLHHFVVAGVVAADHKKSRKASSSAIHHLLQKRLDQQALVQVAGHNFQRALNQRGHLNVETGQRRFELNRELLGLSVSFLRVGSEIRPPDARDTRRLTGAVRAICEL